MTDLPLSPIKLLLAGLGLAFSYKLIGYGLRELVFVPKLTIMKDLPNVGTPRKDGKFPGRAIVCGGSVAGLLAASVCADHFESVLVIEPEAWANEHGDVQHSDKEFRMLADGTRAPVPIRTRVVQYFIIHLIMPPVLLILGRLFPGKFQETVESFGFRPSVMKIRYQYGGIYIEDAYPTSDITSGAPLTLPITRESLETIIRQLVKTHKPSIEIRTGTVMGLTKCADTPDAIQGVTVRSPIAGEDLKEETAALVIDATGPTQAGYSRWLNAAGFPLPPDIRASYDPGMQYTSSYWTVPAAFKAEWPIPWGYQPGLIFDYSPDQKTGETRVLFLDLVDNDKLRLTTGGWSKPDYIHGIQEIRIYAKSLVGNDNFQDWVWEMFDLMEKYEDECKPYYCDAKAGPLTWVHYHKAHLPKNFIALGDANMKLNPIFGQGICKASVEATTLDAVLRAISSRATNMSNISKAFYGKVVPRIEGLWDSTRAIDYGFLDTVPVEGETLNDRSFLRDFNWKITILSRTDADIYKAWGNVTQMLTPATDLFAPWFLYRVYKASMLGRLVS